jgi:hypothetical protein
MKTPKQLGITPKQFKNIAKLTLFVKDKVEPPKFNIRWFFTDKYGEEHDLSYVCPKEEEYQCGTTACFLGYGPLSGVKPKSKETWQEYAKRSYGVGMSGELYDLLFNDYHENDKFAAAKRGAWLLMNGIPSKVNLGTWETPQDFEPDWAAIEKIANQ